MKRVWKLQTERDWQYNTQQKTRMREEMERNCVRYSVVARIGERKRERDGPNGEGRRVQEQEVSGNKKSRLNFNTCSLSPSSLPLLLTTWSNSMETRHALITSFCDHLHGESTSVRAVQILSFSLVDLVLVEEVQEGKKIEELKKVQLRAHNA